MADLDFGFGADRSGEEPQSSGNNPLEKVTQLGEDGSVSVDKNGNSVTDLDNLGNSGTGNEGGDGKPDDKGDSGNDGKSDGEGKQEDPSKGDKYEEGTEIEFEGNVYKIDSKGDLIDKDGKVFKEAKDVKAWMDSLEQITDNTDFDVKAIQDIMGIDITDDKGKVMEFENTKEGVKSYINALLETQANDQADLAYNTLVNRFPFIPDMINYYVANGNSLEGYNDYPDRTGIQIDNENIAQQEAVIRAAWHEYERKGDVEAYIQYLKSSGTLLSVAKAELEGLQESDRKRKEADKQKAEEMEQKKIKELEQYWGAVKGIVDGGKIAGYQIPENIVVTKNGQRFAASREDFFNYIYRIDNDGKSDYVKDLEQTTPESRMQDEILRAYLKFTGGNYSNLIDLAINEKEVTRLRVKAKERAASSVRVRKPNNVPKGTNIDLGYV